MRIDNLTGIRAVAALWVVLYHLNLLQTGLHLRLGRVVSHGEFGVDIFFVLSGFVLTMVYADKLPARFAWDNVRWFLLRRLAKIYPLHLLTLLLMMALVRAGQYLHYGFTSDSDNTPWTAVCNALMVHAWGLTSSLGWNKPSWSVSAEWFAYAVFFVPMVLGMRRVRVPLLVVGAVVLLAALALLSFWLGRPWTTFTTNGVLRILPDFVCGYVLRRMLQGRSAHRGDLVAAAGVAMVVLACYVPYGSLWLLIPGVMTLLTGLQEGGPMADRVFGNRLFIVLGDASYSMYLLQTFVLIVGRQIIARLHLADTISAHVAITVGVLCAVAATGVLCFRFVEEPMRKAILQHLERRGHNPERMPPQDRRGPPDDTQVSAVIS